MGLHLKQLSQSFAIFKLLPNEDVPRWALSSNVFHISKTSDELSIICPETDVPAELEASKGWRCFRVDGELEFDQVGVVARVSSPIANAAISLFLVSTHDRDYVYIHKDDLAKAIDVYKSAQFTVTGI